MPEFETSVIPSALYTPNSSHFESIFPKMSGTKRVYFLVHGGTVQGVGFRYFTQKRAREYSLTGWVRNMPNNKVTDNLQLSLDTPASSP